MADRQVTDEDDLRRNELRRGAEAGYDANWYAALARRYAGNARAAAQDAEDLLYGKTVWGGDKVEHAHWKWSDVERAIEGARDALDNHLTLKELEKEQAADSQG